MKRLKLFLSIFSIFHLFSCAVHQSEQGLSFVFAAQSSDGCTPTGNGDKNFPSDTDIAVKISSGSETVLKKRFVSSDLNSQGEIIITGIPAGDNYSLEVVGCDQNNSPTWSAKTDGISVKENMKTEPYLFLTKKGALNCTGSEYLVDEKPMGNPSLSSAKAFHSSAELTDDRIILTGGVDSNAGGIFSASDTADIYYTGTGTFRQILGENSQKNVLSEKRTFHHSITLSDTEVLIAGGVHSFKFSPLPDKSPITIASPESMIKKYGLEILDISTGKSKGIESSFLPFAFSTMLIFKDSDIISIISTGGIDENLDPQDQIIIVSGKPDDFRNSKVTVKKSSLSVPRIGHSITRLKNGNFFVFGGNISYGDEKSMGEIIKMEKLGSTAFYKYDFSAIKNIYSPAFHSASSVVTANPEDILIIGGNQITSNANFQVAQNTQVMILSISEEKDGYIIKARKVNTGTLDDYFLRSYFSFLEFSGSSFMINGGYRDFTKVTKPSECAGKDICFPQSAFLFSVTADDSPDEFKVSEIHSFKFSSSKLGLSSLRLSDGTVLFSGGITSMTGMTENTEIYNPLPTDEETDLCKSTVNADI